MEKTKQAGGWLLILVVVAATLAAGLWFSGRETAHDQQRIDQMTCEFDPASC